MYSIPFLITHLYPNLPEPDQQRLSDACTDTASEYYGRNFDVTLDNAGEDEVQLNLVMTLYKSQFRRANVPVQNIMQMYESAMNRTLDFTVFGSSAEFYEHYYIFFTFTHFAELSVDQQASVLGTDILTKAIAFGVPVIANVQDYFKQFLTIRVMKDSARVYTAAMEASEAPIGTEGKTVQGVGQWVEMFNRFGGESIETRVDDFIENTMEIGRLAEEDKEIVRRVVTLYYELKTGAIYRSIDPSDVIITDRRGPSTQKSFEDYYIDVLSELDEEQMTNWLADWPHVGLWIVETGKDERFMARFMYTLTQKIALTDDDQVEHFIDFLDSLKDEAGWELSNDLLYFDEKEGGFHWNADVVEVLKEENDRYSESHDVDSSESAESAPPQDLAEGIRALTNDA